MIYLQSGDLRIEGEVRGQSAVAQVIRFAASEPIEGEVMHGASQLELCLLPRLSNTAACYRNRWKANRFEPVGDMFFVPGSEAVMAREDAGCTSSVGLYFRPEDMRSWLGEDIAWTDRQLSACLNLQNSILRGLMLRLADEAQNPGLGSAVIAELIAGQTMIELARHCQAIQEPAPSSGLAPWRLRLIDERVMDMAAPPALSELASLCKLSSRQLARAFRASKGCSIGDYVAQKRMDLAKRRLIGDQDIKTIARDMGFQSASSFTFAFRKAVGETPAQYRLRVLNG